MGKRREWKGKKKKKKTSARHYRPFPYKKVNKFIQVVGNR